MAQESSEVRAFGNGHVYISDSNVTPNFPATISTPITRAMGWIEAGYVAEDGAKFTFAREVNEKFAWQSYDPVRVLITKIPKMVDFELMQWNKYTFALALGGGTVTEPATGEYQYDPPDESFVDIRAVLVEAIDGDYAYRFAYRRCMNQSGVEFATVRSDTTGLPIQMKVLAADAGLKPWFMQTDDPNFDVTDAAS